MQSGECARHADWLVVGSATVDCIVQGDTAVYKSGGVVVYGGLALVRCGESVAACSRLSARDGDVVEPLVKEGVIMHGGDSAQTTSFVNYIAGDARQQRLVAAAAPIDYALLAAVYKQAPYVLLGPLHPRDIDEDVLKHLAAVSDCVVCADVQGFTRYIDGELVYPQIAPQMRAALVAAHIVKVAREELDLLLAWAGCDLAELMRVYGLREVVVTDGSRGGYIRTEAGLEVVFAAHEVREVADPTGAGDVFFATYLSARLRRKCAVKQAAEHAAEHAAAQVAGRFIKADELALVRPHKKIP